MPFDIGVLFAQWQAIGVYEYLLPFLLVFAVVFGILSATNMIGKNKGVHIIISVIIGLMSVGYASSMGYSFGQFLQDLFPRLGVGIAVLLCLLILIGLFIPSNERRYWLYGLGAIGVIIAIIVVSKTFERFSIFASGAYGDYIGYIIGGVLIVGVIIAVAVSGNDKGSGGSTPEVAVIKSWDQK